MRHASAARSALERRHATATTGQGTQDSALVLLHGTLVIEGEGCDGDHPWRKSEARKAAVMATVTSQARLWPKKMTAVTVSHAQRLLLRTHDGDVVLETPIAVSSGSRFCWQQRRKNALENWQGFTGMVKGTCLVLH